MGRVILFLIKSEDEERSLNWTHFGVLDISLLFVLCILIIFFFFLIFPTKHARIVANFLLIAVFLSREKTFDLVSRAKSRV